MSLSYVPNFHTKSVMIWMLTSGAEKDFLHVPPRNGHHTKSDFSLSLQLTKLHGDSLLIINAQAILLSLVPVN